MCKISRGARGVKTDTKICGVESIFCDIKKSENMGCYAMNTVVPQLLLEILQKENVFLKVPKGVITGVAVDSRNVRPGDLFFALPGAKTSGNLFIQSAIQNGAVAVVTSEIPCNIPEGIGILVDNDPLQVLHNTARVFMKHLGPQILAITGSLGKSTTKEFTKSLLSACAPTAATEASCNSQIGLAMSSINALMQSKNVPRWFVAEMGMSEKGELARLVTIVPPEIALITTISPVHAHFFESEQAIAEAKAEIFSSSRCHTSLINSDSPYFEVLVNAAKGKVKTMSMKKKASYSLQIEDATILFEYEGKRIRFKKPRFQARHQFENLLHALSLSCEAGGDVNYFQSAIDSLQMLPRRLENIQKGGVHFINDSYNAAELSMMSALDVLKDSKGKRKIAILGQMRELGNFSQKVHERVGLKAKEASDILICLGEECGPLFEAYKDSKKPAYWFSTLSEIHTILPNMLQEGDVVLLKGSKSNKLWEVVEQFSKDVSHVSDD